MAIAEYAGTFRQISSNIREGSPCMGCSLLAAKLGVGICDDCFVGCGDNGVNSPDEISIFSVLSRSLDRVTCITIRSLHLGAGVARMRRYCSRCARFLAPPEQQRETALNRRQGEHATLGLQQIRQRRCWWS